MEIWQWKTNKQIHREDDKKQGFRRGKGSVSVYHCTKLTALDYVNGDDMRHCRGLGLRWVNKARGIIASKQSCGPTNGECGPS